VWISVYIKVVCFLLLVISLLKSNFKTHQKKFLNTYSSLSPKHFKQSLYNADIHNSHILHN
jgi:hypothetical protein